MPANLLLTGTATRAGKTTVGCALAFAYKVRALRVGVMKPVATGCAERDGALIAADGAALAASASTVAPPELVAPCRYRAPLAEVMAGMAEDQPASAFATITAAYRTLAASSDVMLVEESGGLAAPLDSRHNFADLAVELQLTPLLVVANQGAFLSTAVLTVEYAARRGLAVRGFILNALDREASAVVARDAQAVARATGCEALGTLRYQEPLALAIVARLL